MSATWRRKVDLPPMFGPVMMRIWFAAASSSRSLGMKGSAWLVSMTGWRPSSMRIASPSSTAGRT